MIQITEIWADPAPPHQIVRDTVTIGESVYKHVGKVLLSSFYMIDTIEVQLNTRTNAGLGAVGNSPVNSIVIDGPEELT